ncbi:MAG: DUF4838 domain-containing protein [Candidatus Hydrogenedens sp.]|nr:DUF4838 domain-containing protein [Candidatus Hydrogenedens sp.]
MLSVFRRIVFTSLLLSALCWSGTARAEFWLKESFDFDRGTIVIQQDAPPLIQAAAEMFQALWTRAASAEFPIQTEPGPGINIWLGKGVLPEQIVDASELDDLGNQGYVIRTFTPHKRQAALGIGLHLVISGAHDQGTLNGVSDFFQRIASARWYEPGKTAVKTVVFDGVETVNIAFEPGFKYREVGYHARWTGNENWLTWRRALHLSDEYTHSTRLYPKEWAGGPDEPALPGDGSPFDLESLRATALEWIAAHAATPTADLPRGGRVTVWRDDQDRPVVAWTLNAIPAIRQHFGVAPLGQGVPTPQLGDALALANAVAAGLANDPGQVKTLLKLELAADCPLPPEGTVLAPNIVIQLSNAACDLSRPLLEQHTPENQRFVAALGAWGHVAGELFLADYVCSLHSPITPFPVDDNLTGNLFLYQRFGVSGIYAESWDIPELPVAPDEEAHAHVLAELYWNPDRLMDRLSQTHLESVYYQWGSAIGGLRAGLAEAAAANGGLRPYAPPAWLDADAAETAGQNLALLLDAPDVTDAVKKRARNYAALVMYCKLIAAPRLATRDDGSKFWQRPEGPFLTDVVNELRDLGYGIVTPQADAVGQVQRDCNGKTPPRSQAFVEGQPPN